MLIKEFVTYFDQLSEFRCERTKLHKLLDIVVIAILAVISGAQCFTEIEDFGQGKEEWLRGFLELPNGIPSHDTFARVFARIKPSEFQHCLVRVLQGLVGNLAQDTIAIDGKTLRHSFDSAHQQSALHIVSAWATHCHVSLGQVRVDEKSNEITAIPELLKLLEIKGNVITVDSMGCQRAIAQTIIEKGGDYVLAVKGNQGQLYAAIQGYFEVADQTYFRGQLHDIYDEVNADHGRVEERRCIVLAPGNLQRFEEEWAGLKTLIVVESKRHFKNTIQAEERYYVSSLPLGSAQQFAGYIRDHWSIENALHWSLDVTFREDDCRIRIGCAPENFSLLRKFALSLLKTDTSFKAGIRRKQRKAFTDTDYLIAILKNVRKI
jgi:predicted transposase YbfD/YdcC